MVFVEVMYEQGEWSQCMLIGGQVKSIKQKENRSDLVLRRKLIFFELTHTYISYDPEKPLVRPKWEWKEGIFWFCL